MADTPWQQPPPPSPSSDPVDSLQYWCYQCDKRVSVDTQPDLPDIICSDCKNGFVESVSAAPPSRTPSEQIIGGDTPFGNEFLQVLRLIARTARDDDSPPPPPSEHAADDNDYLRIELDGWDNDNDNDNEGNDNDEEDNGDDDGVNEFENENPRNEEEGEEEDADGSDDEDTENRDGREEEDEDDRRRRRRGVLRLRLRDFASRARRNRILDWAEILMGLEDHSIEFRLQVPGMDDYVGNPGDYVDAAGYEALLQNLAEMDGGGRRGAPPAAKSAVVGLEEVEIKSEEETEVCAICKDTVNVGEMGKKLPCGHGYHGDCIVPWLGSRNTCPVCRFELPTDDPEYEEDRKKRTVASTETTTAVDGCSSSSGNHMPGLN